MIQVTKSGKIRVKSFNGYDYMEVLQSKRNWNDTSSMRLNFCLDCEKDFFGNKYRSNCRLCNAHPEHFTEENDIFKKDK